MAILKKQYEILTRKSKEEIFAELRRKIDTQKGSRISWGLELVNYKNFEMEGDLIRIKSLLLRRTNLYEGLGTIQFTFRQTGDLTAITCTIEPCDKYATLFVLFFSTIFLFAFSVVIMIMLHDQMSKAMIMMIFACTMVYGGIYFNLKYNRNLLEQYSKTVLNDLGVKIISSDQNVHLRNG